MPALVACIVLAVGCAAHRIRPSDVVVFDKGATVPAGCHLVAKVTASDGRHGAYSTDGVDGSRERVLNRLKRAAAKREGTAIAVRDEPQTICVDCYGSIVELHADVLRCPS
jgi:hypothetical protein